MNKIKIMSNDLINKISAGPLILKPYYVVKELIENSLDAKSDFISINLIDGGKTKILVRDNGEGISKSDLLLTIKPHATSKLNCFENLKNINTFGFRGEALSSISSISKFSILSKTKNQDIAWSLTKNSFNNIELNVISHPIGTTVEVLNIFFNISIKRISLNSVNTEFYLLHNLIKQFALLYNNVSFEIIHNNKLVKLYNNSNFIKELSNKKLIINKKNIINILGISYFNKLLSFECNDKNKQIYIKAWISNFSFSYVKKYNIKYYYINNRLIFNEPIINHAINQAYNFYYKYNDYVIPSFIIQIKMNSNDLDININPSKTKIKFRYERLIHDLIYNNCLSTLYKLKDNYNKLNNNIKKKKIYKLNENTSLIQTDINNNIIKYLCNKQSNIYNIIKLKKSLIKNIRYKNKFFGKSLFLLEKNFLLTKSNNNLILIDLSKAEIFLRKIQLYPNKNIYIINLSNYTKINLLKYQINILNLNFLKLKNFGINYIYKKNILYIKSIPLGLRYQNLSVLILNLIDYLSISKDININIIYDWLIINTINKNNIWNKFNTKILLQELELFNLNLLNLMNKYWYYIIDNKKFLKKIITNNLS